MKSYVFLMLAIMLEILATSSLKASTGFTRLVPSLAALLGYTLCFYCLALSLRHVPLGVAYAIWSGVGTAATAAIGVTLWKEPLHGPQLVGLVMIVAGVVVLNLQGSAAHE